jgi:hypothetical protein
MQTLTKVTNIESCINADEDSVFQDHTRRLNKSMQLEDIKFRNMCGSNPLQFHLSQSSDPRFYYTFKIFPYTAIFANSEYE